ncbi:hypothetical protein [Gordonia aichiensis]|uniref:Uncharacterized protein n=1 Tax=Gordonia aichiensis NBRC 108223 TaxID=1220583 RepID=L7KLI3_9ACTN|nr:hypothetical protein [Gordonia aichiensis]GAC48817.1 hypothetical protein GOACH_07_01010 [Gordonia aichiensis NBRC 108223]
MHDPNSAIPDDAKPALWLRYDEWRGERHRQFIERHAHKLVGWRRRTVYRRLVVVQAICAFLVLVGAVIAFFSRQWFIIPLGVGILGALACQRLLRIVTGSVGDAPVSALDEIQLAQRNSARSIAYFALFTLMFIPYIILVTLGGFDEVRGQYVYGTGMLLIALVLGAVFIPSMLTAWWMADVDPEDLEIGSGVGLDGDLGSHIDPGVRHDSELHTNQGRNPS